MARKLPLFVTRARGAARYTFPSMPSCLASRRPRPVLACLVLGVAGLASGCATGQPVDWPMIARLGANEAAGPALSGRIEAAAGVALAEPGVVDAGSGWVAFTLNCPDEARCRQATARLAAEPQLFVEVRRDELRHIPQRPSGPSIR